MTEREKTILMTYLARMRVREAELSILGIVRSKGVEIFLDAEGKLIVRGATQEQIDDLRKNKELIHAALRAEKQDGPSWDHSALKAGIDKLYETISDNHEFGAARRECELALEMLDGFLMELDEAGWNGLPDAIARFAKHRPAMEPLIRKINEERASMLEGGPLREAAEAVFKDSMKAPARIINMEAFA